jgi:hypothetical protein
VHVNGDEISRDAYVRLVALLEQSPHPALAQNAAQILHVFEAAGVTDVELIFEQILRRKS